MDILAAYVAADGSVQDTAALVGIRPNTVKRHLADLRAGSGLTTEQLIYAGRAGGWRLVPSLSPSERGQVDPLVQWEGSRLRHGDDHVAALVSVVDVPVRLDDVVQGIGAVDHRA